VYKDIRIFVAIWAAVLGMTWSGQTVGALQNPGASRPYVFVAAPRETEAQGMRVYGPIAAFLTEVLGHKVVYEHPNGWLTYELWIWEDHADIYFDGPQFMAWRMIHLDQTIGPRVPQPQDWRLYTWKGSPVTNLQEAANGASLCAPPVPNFGTLWVTSLFRNPSRQPFIRNTSGWTPIFKAVRNHSCTLGIGPKLTIESLDPHHQLVTILKKGPAYPNQGFTVSAKLPLSVRTTIVHALLSPAGEKAMMPLRKRYSHGLPLVDGHPADYKDVDQGLDAQWGTIYAASINRYLEIDAKNEGLSTARLMAP